MDVQEIQEERQRLLDISAELASKQEALEDIAAAEAALRTAQAPVLIVAQEVQFWVYFFVSTTLRQ